MVKKKRFDMVFYTYLVCLYPLLSMYSFWNSSFSYADVLSFIFLFVMILNRPKIQFKVSFLIILGLIITHFIFLCMFYDNIQISQMFGSTFRLLLIYFLISIKNHYFESEKGIKIFIVVSIIATIYLIIQYIMSKFGVYLSGGIPGLNILRENVYSYINDVTKYDLVYRARSIFEEPAHYCQYIVVAINLLLYKCEYNKKNILITLFLIFGVILSMSLLGWALTIISLIVWLSSKRVKHYKKLIILLLIILSPILFVFFTNSSYVKNVYIRKFVDQSILEDDRFSSFGQVLKGKTLSEIIFGHGLIKTETYINGIPRIIYTYGLLGLLIIILLYLLYLRKTKNSEISKALLFLLAVLTFSSEIIFGKYLVTYLIFCESKKRIDLKKGDLT